jgi:hypothetical protein
VLYPDDRTYEGKELRLKQQHFFVSATLQVGWCGWGPGGSSSSGSSYCAAVDVLYPLAPTLFPVSGITHL